MKVNQSSQIEIIKIIIETNDIKREKRKIETKSWFLEKIKIDKPLAK
jgi:hypothetical protein